MVRDGIWVESARRKGRVGSAWQGEVWGRPSEQVERLQGEGMGWE